MEFEQIVKALSGQTVPDVIYKYRRWDDSNHRRIIERKEFYFAAAKDFDDPYELRIPFRYDLVSEEDKRRWIKDQFRERHGDDRSELEVERMLENWTIHMDEYLIRGFYEMVSENWGICSFSKNHTNLSQWANYADAHRGFCIGISRTILVKLFAAIYSQEGNITPLYQFLPVEYVKEIPAIKPFGNNDESVRLLALKSIDWEKEDEVRLIRLDGARVSDVFPDELFTKVIIGANMQADLRENLIAATRSNLPECRIIQARLADGRFGLEFDEIY